MQLSWFFYGKGCTSPADPGEGFWSLIYIFRHLSYHRFLLDMINHSIQCILSKNCAINCWLQAVYLTSNGIIVDADILKIFMAFYIDTVQVIMIHNETITDLFRWYNKMYQAAWFYKQKIPSPKIARISAKIFKSTSTTSQKTKILTNWPDTSGQNQTTLDIMEHFRLQVLPISKMLRPPATDFQCSISATF